MQNDAITHNLTVRALFYNTQAHEHPHIPPIHTHTHTRINKHTSYKHTHTYIYILYAYINRIIPELQNKHSTLQALDLGADAGRANDRELRVCLGCYRDLDTREERGELAFVHVLLADRIDVDLAVRL